MPSVAKTYRAVIALWFSLLLTGCPIGDQTVFYQVRGSVFSAQNVGANNVSVSAISVSWHAQSVMEAVAHHTADRKEIIWRIEAVKPVLLAGLEFEVFKTPSGFKTVVSQRKIPKGGVLSLDIYSDKSKNTYIYHEFSANELRR